MFNSLTVLIRKGYDSVAGNDDIVHRAAKEFVRRQLLWY